MVEGIEKRLIGPVGIVGGALAAVGVLVSVWFAGVVVIRLADALTGSGYQFQSVGDYLGIEEYENRALTWDRSFLLLGAALAAFTLAGMADDFVEWARKSPEQRRRDRERALEAQCEAKEAADAQKEQKANERHARKAARKPMSGWRRLWIVLSVVFGGLTFIVAYENYSRASSYVPWNGDRKAFWTAARADRALGNCNWATAKAAYPSGGSYIVSCDTADPWLFASLWALVPALFMALLGLMVRWVYRGFRPSKAHV